MKNKEFKSKTYTEGDITYTTIYTEIGQFTGKAKFNREADPFSSSMITGGRMSESRAYIKYYKERIKLKKVELKGMKRLADAIPPIKKPNKQIYNLCLALHLEISKYEEKIKDYQTIINNLVESRAIYVRSRSTDKKLREKNLKQLGDAIAALKTVKKDKTD